MIEYDQQQIILRVDISEEMNPLTQSPYFPPYQMTQQQMKQLQNKSIEAECSFLRSQSNNNQMEEQPKEPYIDLQIVGDYILQKKANGYLMCFRVDYQIQFQIVRLPANIPNRLGQPIGIKFIFKIPNAFIVQLAVKSDNLKQLEIFGKTLGKKFIVQLGFHTTFKAIKKIGKGMTACVYDAINFANGRQVAIKSFKRSVYFSQDNGNGKLSFINQFKILTEVNHRNLCQLLSVYETDNSTYVILELYPLSLYGYIQKCGFPSLQLAKCMLINLLEGIAYLHQKGIMHRDLKLENIMVKKESNGRVTPVIVDFGLAEHTSHSKYLYTRCGTPGYVAPQVLKIKSSDPIQTYSAACDIFSIGVIFHILLFKKPLFQGKDVKEVIKKNCDCQIDFESDLFKALPESGRQLFEMMLNRDPLMRISARDALNHPFLIDQRKKMQIEMQNVYQTDYSIFA